MLNRLLYEYYKSPNNGRQVTSLPDGRRVLLVHSEMTGPSTLRLLLARGDTPQAIADFDDVGTLTGPESIAAGAGPWGLGGSLVAVDNILHVAWTGPHGIQYTRATWTGRKLRWDRAQQALEGDYWLGDLFTIGKQVALTYHRVHDRQTESVGVGRLDRKRRELHTAEQLVAHEHGERAAVRRDVGRGRRRRFLPHRLAALRLSPAQIVAQRLRQRPADQRHADHFGIGGLGHQQNPGPPVILRHRSGPRHAGSRGRLP